MKLTLIMTVLAGFILLSRASLAQDTDPCAKVSCSGHGTCVIKGDDPVCACENGYQADSVGLSCVPNTPVATETRTVKAVPDRVVVKPAPHAASSRPPGRECAWDDHCRVSKKCHRESGECISRTMYKAHETDGRNFKVMRTLGGTVLVLGGVTFFVIILLDLVFKSAPKYISSVGMPAIATSVGIGIPLLLVGLIGRKRYEARKAAKFSKNDLNFTPSFFVSDTNGGLGLSASF